MPLSLLLAFRFLRSSNQEKNISVMIKICFFSILVATCALTLVAAIMNGFERATHSKLQGVHADITINAFDKAIDYEKLKKVLSTEYTGSIQAISPSSMSQVIVQNTARESRDFTICLLKAVDPQEEQKVSSLRDMIIKTHNNQNPWQLLTSNTLFIGAALAQQLQVNVGDKLTLLYPEEATLNHKVSLEEKEVTVGALFKTGINDFDEHVIVASFELARQLYPINVNQVSITLTDPRKEHEVIASLKKRLSLDVFSWKDLYPSLVSALLLEKYAMLFILALVTLVASLNIISLLFMYVTQKRTDIAVLKTMGMSDRSLMSIFMIVSGLITCAATACGMILAAIITMLLNTFPFIKLPDAYFASHLPATLDARIIISIIVLALMVSIVSAFIPARKIKSMIVARVLKSIA